jgi:hypothetical protein
MPGRRRAAMQISAGRWPGSPSSYGDGSGWSTRWPGRICCCTGSAADHSQAPAILVADLSWRLLPGGHDYLLSAALYQVLACHSLVISGRRLLPLPSRHTSGNSPARSSDLRPPGWLPFQSARHLKFPQLSTQIRRRRNRLPIYSIRRCGGWAGMGQWVVSVLGHDPLPHTG